MTKNRINIHIPEITIKYWMLMILATTIGEIVGNLISRNFEIGYSRGSMLLIGIYVLLLLSLVVVKKQNYIFYWLLIILGNIAGTNCADFITIEPLELGAIYGSLLIMGILTLILIVWKVIAPKSNIEDGLTKRTYFLYWFAILASSTFGTTSGDFLTNDTSLGAGGGTMLLMVMLIIIALLVTYRKISLELSYWAVLVVMHPIGATIGNYISKPIGLNFGNIWTSVVLILMFVTIYKLNFIKK